MKKLFLLFVFLGACSTGSSGSSAPLGASNGEQGLQGPQGLEGPQGIQGPKGDPGPSGAQGPMGPQGPEGQTGQQGPVGPQGLQGAQGVKGDPGTPGSSGAPGAQGPKGDTGTGFNAASIYRVDGAGASMDSNGHAVAKASCAAGEIALSGGCIYTGNGSTSSLTRAWKWGVEKDTTGWFYQCVGVGNPSDGTSVFAHAYCMKL